MELLTILLSGLLGLVSPVTFTMDRIAENSIRERLYSAEQLEVRFDNTPTYQLLQGKVDGMRIAGRGLYLKPEIRIDTLEVETDPIVVDRKRLREDKETSPAFLRQPLQGAVRLVLTEEDMNKALRSPALANQLQEMGVGLATGTGAEPQEAQRFEIINPQLDFLGNNRLRFQMEIQQRDKAERQKLTVESALGLVSARQLQLVSPQVLINDRIAPPKLVNLVVKLINRRLDLQTYETRGLRARVLEFQIAQDQLEIAAFMRIENPQQPSAPSLP